MWPVPSSRTSANLILFQNLDLSVHNHGAVGSEFDVNRNMRGRGSKRRLPSSSCAEAQVG